MDPEIIKMYALRANTLYDLRLRIITLSPPPRWGRRRTPPGLDPGSGGMRSSILTARPYAYVAP